MTPIDQVVETLLASIRADLLNDHTDVLLDKQLVANRTHLFAEHAIDACLARGATTADVIDAADKELRRRGQPPTPEPLNWHQEHDDLDYSPELGTTYGAFKREAASHLVQMLTSMIDIAASQTQWAEAEKRMTQNGLDLNDTPIGAVMTDSEIHQSYQVGLFHPTPE